MYSTIRILRFPAWCWPAFRENPLPRRGSERSTTPLRRPESRLMPPIEIAIDALPCLLVSLLEEVGHFIDESHSPHTSFRCFRSNLYKRNGQSQRTHVPTVLRARG